MTIPRILVVAGSDSGGGAGIQADIKTITVLGGYAATAITALTAQNTQGVFGVLPVPVDFVIRQIRVVLDDIGADALKSGMLYSTEIMLALADLLEERANPLPYILDPVMVSTSGSRLLEAEAVSTLKTRLLPQATLVTPNIPEAEILLGRKIDTIETMVGAAQQLQQLCPAVLLKGGHLDGAIVADVLCDAAGIEIFKDSKLTSRNTHGTGCTLASAIAVGLGRGIALKEAIIAARLYVRGAIRTAPDFGQGAGPLNHMHPFTRPT